MLKQCIIGSCDDTFRSVGGDFDFVEAESKNEVKERLRRMSSRDYSVIYITEDFFDVIYEDSTKYIEAMMPEVKSIASSKHYPASA